MNTRPEIAVLTPEDDDKIVWNPDVEDIPALFSKVHSGELRALLLADPAYREPVLSADEIETFRSISSLFQHVARAKGLTPVYQAGGMEQIYKRAPRYKQGIEHVRALFAQAVPQAETLGYSVRVIRRTGDAMPVSPAMHCDGGIASYFTAATMEIVIGDVSEEDRAEIKEAFKQIHRAIGFGKDTWSEEKMFMFNRRVGWADRIRQLPAGSTIMFGPDLPHQSPSRTDAYQLGFYLEADRDADLKKAMGLEL